MKMRRTSTRVENAKRQCLSGVWLSVEEIEAMLKHVPKSYDPPSRLNPRSSGSVAGPVPTLQAVAVLIRKREGLTAERACGHFVSAQQSGDGVEVKGRD